MAARPAKSPDPLAAEIGGGMKRSSDVARIVIEHLRCLVAFDTRNPPRRIAAETGILDYLRGVLSRAFTFETLDLGDGCVNLLATRGRPRLLFNIHLDTVPTVPGWQQRDPFDLEVTSDGRAVGLGACDIKGAAACMLTAIEIEPTGADVALLFTTDEEHGKSRCVREFMRRGDLAVEAVLVAEPTECRAVLAHRGLATCEGEFVGISGHGATSRALKDNAVHKAVRWAATALKLAESEETDEFHGLRGLRFNIGSIEGGTKPNMIAASAHVRWGVRPLPGQDVGEIRSRIMDCAPESDRVDWRTGFTAPPLPTCRAVTDRPQQGRGPAADESAAESAQTISDAYDTATRAAERLGLPVGDPVDFWTEAALFSEAGHTAIVFGPGNIAQAHTAGEWVSLDQLVTATQTYRRLLSSSSG